MDTSRKEVLTYGGHGGKQFGPGRIVPIELGFWYGDAVDKIVINQREFGGRGGQPSKILRLDPDEYFKGWSIQSDKIIFRVRFNTNKSRIVECGESRGRLKSEVENARLLAIGGRFGQYLDRLEILCITNYKPSKEFKKKQRFILSYNPPRTEFKTFEETSQKNIYAWERVTSHMVSQEYNASVEGEYYAKVTASTKIEIQDSQTTTIRKELENSQTKSFERTQSVGEEEVGFSIVEGTVMKAQEGKQYWMFPTGPVNFNVVKLTDIQPFLGCYDLTNTLDTQVVALKKHRREVKGFVYYE